MPTSLQQQVARWEHRTGTVPLAAVDSSFLFSAKDAAENDRTTVHQIGLKGLGELAHLDSRFNNFLWTLFAPNVLEYTRETSLPKDLVLVDEAVGHFLALLSPYYLLECSGYAIEFLVRFYRVHVHNVDSIMRCILPYHGHPLFCRMLNIMKLSRTMWEWLEPLQKKRTIPLPRQALVDHCRRDKLMLRAVCRWTHQGVKEDVAYSGSIALYASLVMDLLAVTDPKLKTFNFELLKIVMPQMLHSYTSTNEDWQTAGLMVTIAFCHTLDFSSELLHNLLRALLQALHGIVTHARPGFDRVLKCLLVMFQTQPLLQGPKAAITVPTLLWGADWRPYLEPFLAVTGAYDSGNFLRFVFASLTRRRLAASQAPKAEEGPKKGTVANGEEEDDEDDEEEGEAAGQAAEEETEVPDTLALLLQSMQGSSRFVDQMVTDCWVQLTRPHDDALEEAAAALLHTLELRYPVEFDAAVARNAKTSRHPEQVLAIISRSAGCGRHAEVLAVHSPIAVVRADALRKLDSLMETGSPHDVLYVETTVEQALATESSPDTLTAILQLKALPRVLRNAPAALGRILLRFTDHVPLMRTLLRRLPELLAAEVAADPARRPEAVTQYTLLLLPWLLAGPASSGPEVAVEAAHALAAVDPEHFGRLATVALDSPASLNAAVLAATTASVPASQVDWLANLLGRCGEQFSPSISSALQKGLVVVISVCTEVLGKVKLTTQLCEAVLRAIYVSLAAFAQERVGPPAPSKPELLQRLDDAAVRPLVLACYADLLLQLMTNLSPVQYADLDRDCAHFAVLQQLYLSGCRLRDCGAAGDALLDHLLGRILGPHGIPFLATFWLGAEQMPALGAEANVVVRHALLDARACLACPKRAAFAPVILPTLLVPLCSDAVEVRKAAVKFFRTEELLRSAGAVEEDEATLALLYRTPALPGDAAPPGGVPYRLLVEAVRVHRDLLLRQAGNLTWVLSGLAGPSTGADGAAAQRDMAQWLLRHVLRWLARYPASVAAVLRCLQEDRASPRLLQQARPLLRRFLDRADGQGDAAGFTKEEAAVAPLLFRLLRAVAGPKGCSPKNWPLLMRTLRATTPLRWTHSHFPAIGMHPEVHEASPGSLYLYPYALEVLQDAPTILRQLSEAQKVELCAALGFVLGQTVDKAVPQTLVRYTELHRVAGDHLGQLVGDKANWQLDGDAEAAPAVPKKRRLSGATAPSSFDVEKRMATPTALLEVLTVFHGEGADPDDDIRLRAPALMAHVRQLLRRLFRRITSMEEREKATVDYLAVLALNLLSRLVVQFGQETSMDFDTGELIRIIQRSPSHETRVACLKLLTTIGHTEPKQVATACIHFILSLGGSEDELPIVKQVLSQLLPIVMREKQQMEVDGDEEESQEGAQLYVALFFLLRHELALEERLSVEDKQAGRIARAVDLPMFCHSLLLEFPVSQQLTQLSLLVPVLYGSVTRHSLGKVFRQLEADADTCPHTVRIRVLQFISEHLHLPALANRIRRASKRRVLQQAQTELFVVSILSFDFMEALAAQGAPMAEVQELVDGTRSVLQALNAICDLEVFVSAVGLLLDHHNPAVRHIALQILTEKVEQLSGHLTSAAVKLFMLLLPQFTTLLRKTLEGGQPGAEVYAEQVIVVSSIGVLARRLVRGWSLPQLKEVTELLCKVLQQHPPGPGPGYAINMHRHNVTGCCAAALATLFQAHSTDLLAFLPIFLPLILRNLTATLAVADLKKPDTATQNLLEYQEELMKAIGACFAAVPGMMPPYVAPILHCALHRHLLQSPRPAVVEQAQRLVLLVTGCEYLHLQDPILETLCSTSYESHDHVALLKVLQKALRGLEKAPLLGFGDALVGPVMKRLQDYFAALTSPFLAPADVCDALAHALFCAVRLLREAQFQ
eukprot:EG_transcript_153